MVTLRNIKEAFEGHRGLPLESFYYGDRGFEDLLSRKAVEASFEIDVELSKNTINKMEKIIQEKKPLASDTNEKSELRITWEKYLRYFVTLQIEPATGILRVIDEKLSAIKPNGEEKSPKSRSPFIETIKEKDLVQVHLRMEKQAHPSYLESGTDHTAISTSLFEPYYPHINAFKMELSGWQAYYLEPRDLMREEQPVKAVDRIEPSGKNFVAFLNILDKDHNKEFENYYLSARQLITAIQKLKVEPNIKGLVDLTIYERNIPFSPRVISEGTLRILGLLAILHPRSNVSTVGYEEPENGVHPVRLKLIADLFKNVSEGGKQIIVTTHSPTLPSFFKQQNLLICQKVNGETKIRKFKEFGPLFKDKQIEKYLEESIIRGDFGG